MHRAPAVVQPVLAQFRASAIGNQCCQTVNWTGTGGFTLLNTRASSKTPQSKSKFQCKNCSSPLAGSIYSENEMGWAGQVLQVQRWRPKAGIRTSRGFSGPCTGPGVSPEGRRVSAVLLWGCFCCTSSSCHRSVELVLSHAGMAEPKAAGGGSI